MWPLKTCSEDPEFGKKFAIEAKKIIKINKVLMTYDDN